MPLDIVVGTQWGDEGKGRVVDLLSAQAALVARYNGGDNAGHTVQVGDRTFKLHIIPSGIIHAHTRAVIGPGCVINPATLQAEMKMLAENGVEVPPTRLRLAYSAHLITPAHRAMDAAREAYLADGQIGTTGRGIGPAYTDKASRRGLRMADMLNPLTFSKKLREHVQETNRMIRVLYMGKPVDVDSVVEEYTTFARTFKDYIGDAALWVEEALKNKERVLAEGAQGTLLDIDAGTYPFVTSSHPIAPAAMLGLGIGIVPVGRVTGVSKSFQTRVGSGPFPTELEGPLAERLRGTGSNPWDEFGTTTGRPRRVGWLDGVLLRYSCRVNGFTDLVVTKMDVLSGFEKLKICTAYTTAEAIAPFTDLPTGPAELEPYQPVYEELPGWERDLRKTRRWRDLPSEAQAYIKRMEEIAGAPVAMISVGPERDQIIERKV